MAIHCEKFVLADRTLTLCFVAHPNARRYRLTMRRDGTLRCTLPSRGSLLRARAFVETSRNWIKRRMDADPAWGKSDLEWGIGSGVWFRGRKSFLTLQHGGEVHLDHWRLGQLPVPVEDFRPWVEQNLRKLAVSELPLRARELAKLHGFESLLKRITVRNQRTRWGSCSRRGTVSLNWRLVQTPEGVRDYIILHEFAHLRVMNHSKKFWSEVERLCPDFQSHETWLRKHGRQVL
jgi:predicted metal-dependent hydrolase